ncbi:NACHT domain-containing protein [Streptomyces griseorubiginosus]|uniref:NACHT domain-containing protein n=1 Tax=Streptomyces griseorubiginosus TaxID=67304 RepID=UPI00366498EE
MAAPTAGPVADFCAALGRLVNICDVSQRDIADALGLSTSSVSELLGGRRRKVPDLDVVRTIVELCAERNSGRTPPAGANLDVRWWKSRHAELEWTASARQASGRPRSEPNPPALSAPMSQPPPDVMACAVMSVTEAVQLLAAGRMRTRAAVDALTSVPRSRRGQPRILGELLAGFPDRVRATHGVERTALIQAARVVLVAGAVMLHAKHEDGPRLIAGLTENGHEAHTPPLGELDSFGRPETLRPIVSDYVQLATPLANACPEFALGAGLPGVAPSGEVTTTGLAGLGKRLSELAGDHGLPYEAHLRAPIAALDSPGPLLPSLVDGYITPRFRLAADSREAVSIASDKWWDEQPLHGDIERFLAEHLLSLPALLTPLVVLGHPGAGKSLLTRLLAARLPAQEFRPLRVELRHTPADIDVQAQLEYAVRRVTGREERWPDWSERVSGPVPVILLDGFDELLQAGAQKIGQGRQWSYLREVKEFQAREAQQGRPLIVIVTSRTVVADRADIPATSPVVRLEPFEETEIERWLAVWNAINTDYFAQHQLLPLTPEVVLPHRDLAAQPLLLLMLALYDAVGNTLHLLRNEAISRTELYDRLLTEFVRRQVNKDGPLSPSETAAAVDRELHRLSVIALSMFHRGAQSISGEEADRNLRALGVADDGSGLLFGRFFFVHEAQAVITDNRLHSAENRLHSYEFMHATFGEHLAARLVEGALRRLLDGENPVDDGELYALLSFAPLTERAQLMQNLRNMLEAWPHARAHGGLVPTLLRLFNAASWEPKHRTDVEYAPIRARRRYREAVYEVNLVLIAVLVAGEVHVSDLFGDALAPTAEWRRYALGWQSQLSVGSWAALTSTLTPVRCWHRRGKGQDAESDLCLTTGRTELADHTLNWSMGVPPPTVSRSLSDRLENHLSDTPVPDLIRQIRFVGDRDTEQLLHLSYPMLLQFPSMVSVFRPTPGNEYHAAAHPLVALLTRDVYKPTEVPGLYLQCLHYVEVLEPRERSSYLEAVLRQLVHDAPTLPDAALADIIEALREAYDGDSAPFTGVAYQTFLLFLRHAVDRESPQLADPLEGLRLMHSIGDSLGALESLLELSQLSRSTHTWRWAGVLDQWAAIHHFDDLLARLDLAATAATHPNALLDLLRLAAELGLDGWLTRHTSRILAALPPQAFGLLRPSDLGSLRAALPMGAYVDQFAEVEKAWRAQE